MPRTAAFAGLFCGANEKGKRGEEFCYGHSGGRGDQKGPQKEGATCGVPGITRTGKRIPKLGTKRDFLKTMES